MKRFWLVLLTLGLVLAFSASAFAVDVKVSGEYYAAGLYLNKTTLNDARWDYDRTNPSTAFFFQRLRIGTDFILSPSLKLVTRFDAMERIWGGARSAQDPTQGPNGIYQNHTSAGTTAENENIAFDLTYVEYISPIGMFRVGYQPDYEWGTVFGNRTTGDPAGIITYGAMAGPITLVAQYAKEKDMSRSAVDPYATTTDRDYDSYRLGVIYNFNTSKAKGEVGGLFLWERDATNKPFNGSPTFAALPHVGIGGGLYLNELSFTYLTNAYKAIPYFKVNIGPVALQGEAEYTFGDAMKWEDSDGASNPYGLHNSANVSISAISVFLDATATFGPVYVGGTFAYLSGDDPGTNDKLEGSNSLAAVNTSGLDWNPCLILFNNEVMTNWVGGLNGHSDSQASGEMSNAWFFQGRVGVKPTPQLDAVLSVSFATADKKPDPKLHSLANSVIGGPYYSTTQYGNGNYGTEIDLTGTYKITNNLSYMLGAGYLFTGDYFKGYDYPRANYKIVDDYMIINKLTLSF
jgi:hypothetical protein